MITHDRVVHIGSPSRLLIEGIQTYDITNGERIYLDSATTVQVTLRDRATQVNLTGDTWPRLASYIVGTKGNFHLALSNAMVITDYQPLEAVITIDNGIDDSRTIIVPCVARKDLQ